MNGPLACSGAFCAFATEAAGFSQLFPGLTSRLLTLSGQFGYYNLGYRELMLATGACAATKQGMETLFKQASFEECYVKKYAQFNDLKRPQVCKFGTKAVAMLVQ